MPRGPRLDWMLAFRQLVPFKGRAKSAARKEERGEFSTSSSQKTAVEMWAT